MRDAFTITAAEIRADDVILEGGAQGALVVLAGPQEGRIRVTCRTGGALEPREYSPGDELAVVRYVQIQGVGKVPGRPADHFAVGDRMMWNYGHTSEVVERVRETEAFITFALRGSDGEVRTRRLGRTRLVAVAP